MLSWKTVHSRYLSLRIMMIMMMIVLLLVGPKGHVEPTGSPAGFRVSSS